MEDTEHDMLSDSTHIHLVFLQIISSLPYTSGFNYYSTQSRQDHQSSSHQFWFFPSRQQQQHADIAPC